MQITYKNKQQHKRKISEVVTRIGKGELWFDAQISGNLFRPYDDIKHSLRYYVKTVSGESQIRKSDMRLIHTTNESKKANMWFFYPEQSLDKLLEWRKKCFSYALNNFDAPKDRKFWWDFHEINKRTLENKDFCEGLKIAKEALIQKIKNSIPNANAYWLKSATADHSHFCVGFSIYYINIGSKSQKCKNNS